MKKEQQPEKPIPPKCFICAATPVDPSTEGVGSDYAFCAGISRRYTILRRSARDCDRCRQT